MSNIDINLIRARDGAAPQHKVSNANKFELTEGSDGAQHVKIVDSEGNVQDKISVELPDKQIVTVDNQIQLPTDYPDKAVEARLQAIESKQQAILDKLESGLDTRLTGSNVKQGSVHSTEILVAREIRTKNLEVTNITVPLGVSSAYIYLTIFGATGKFGAEQGARLRLRPARSPLSNRPPIEVNSAWSVSANSTQMFAVGQGFAKSDATPTPYGGYDVKFIGIPIGSRIGFGLSVAGTFDIGEGVDCQVEVAWIN